MKMFKKLMAVALVAVMALCMFTACGVNSDDMKDALNSKTGLTYDSSLKTDEAYKSVDKVFDDLKRTATENDIEDKLDSKIDSVTLTEGTAIIYATNGNENELAKDIASQIEKLEAKNSVTYRTYAYDIHNGSNTDKNAVLVIVSTAEKAA